MRPSDRLKRLDLFLKVLKKAIGVSNAEFLGSAMIDQILRNGCGFTARSPVSGIAATRCTSDRRAKSRIPVSRPAADNETVFVKNSIEASGKPIAIRLKLTIDVQDTRIEIIPVHLEDEAA